MEEWQKTWMSPKKKFQQSSFVNDPGQRQFANVPRTLRILDPDSSLLFPNSSRNASSCNGATP